MKIMEIVSGAEINGAVVHCALLTRELMRRGHAVTLVCRHDAKVQRLLSDLDLDIVESDMHRWPLDELRRIGALARSRGVQIIHTHMTRAHNFGVFLRRFAHAPCVATAHSHIVQPLTWIFNDHVIAVSEATQRFQQRRNFVRRARIETVHGFTDFERQSGVSPGARERVRSELGVDQETPLVGLIGDIIPRKGHIYMIRALPEIARTVPEARLLIVGDPKRKIGCAYFERVKSEIERLGVADRVIWAGYRSDVPDVMKALDVYVLASLDEMFPVAALEAMSACLPIVATQVGGVPECLTSEENALLVPAADPDALARAVIRLLHDRTLANRLAERAHEVARDEFSLQSQTPRIEHVFERIVERYSLNSIASAGGGRKA